MNVSPTFYQNLIMLLSGLAEGKIAVCLEGGYFLPSLAEGALRTLLGLLDFPPPPFPTFKVPHPCVAEVINNLKFFLRPYWKCFSCIKTESENCHTVELKYLGKPDLPPYLTRDCYPVNSKEEIRKYTDFIDNYKKGR